MRYSATEAAKRAGLSYRQVDYWLRTGVASCTVEASGTGSRRWFSRTDVERLVVLSALRREGYTLEALRRWSVGEWQPSMPTPDAA
jgi:DNA-binding transcriptional MerR regulator